MNRLMNLSNEVFIRDKIPPPPLKIVKFFKPDLGFLVKNREISCLQTLIISRKIKKLKLPTMAYRRARGDMIEVFKIVAQIYDNKTKDNVLNFRGKLNVSLSERTCTLIRTSCPAFFCE